MATQITLPPDTRVPFGGDPAGDIDLVIDALNAMQATLWVRPTGDTSGVADAANVMAAYAALPVVGGAPSGVIWMAPGLFYFAAGSVIINAPQVKIKGVLRWATQIRGVGTGDVIRMYNPTAGGGGFWGGGVEDVVVDGTSMGNGSVLVHIGDGEQYEVNVAVQNCTGTGSWGVLFDNTIWWTEKLHGTVFARNCANHIGFNVSGATTSTNSFGYLDLTCYVYIQSGQDGVVIQNGAYPYNGKLIIKGNAAGTTPQAVVRLTGQVPAGHPAAGAYSRIYACEFSPKVETGSSPGPYTIYYGTAGSNTIQACRGIMDFSQGSGAFTGSNAVVSASAGSLTYDGMILGDGNLNPAGNFPHPVCIGSQVLARSFMSGANGNTFSEWGDFFSATLSASITISLSPSSQNCLAAPQRKTIVLKQAASGGPYTVAWPHAGSPTVSSPTVLWVGAAPTMSPGANAVDVYDLETLDGATWYGRALQNVS